VHSFSKTLPSVKLADYKVFAKIVQLRSNHNPNPNFQSRLINQRVLSNM